MKKIGILVSHQGTNFQAIVDACDTGRIGAKIVVAISNNSQSEGLKRARRASIEAVHLSSSTHPNPDDLDAAIARVFESRNVDIVVTAGYMKKLGSITLRKFSGKILNVHPSLLPKHGGKGMFGMNVHKAVIKAGDSESGITIHWLDEQYDTGPLIAQKRVRVFDGDTPESLAKRILVEEHELLVATLEKLTKDGEI
ncbi:MAG: phosphoribosylglycinamide formyltransferase [Pseudomonadales bacterium]|nr:phosphoribosylglycinamide formyltransferase [Pseudomonadales bacterium]